MSREVMQQALDALVWASGSEDFAEGGVARKGALKLLFPAIDALDAELAKPKQPYYETHEAPHCPTCECGEAKSGAIAEAIAAGDGTLHGAIDHWQARALKAEAELAKPAAVPEAREYQGLDVWDAGYTAGWNACREAMLASHPPVPAAADHLPDAKKMVPVPEGWVLVPKEMPDEMVAAMHRSVLDYGVTGLHSIWESLIEAAPQPDPLQELVDQAQANDMGYGKPVDVEAVREDELNEIADGAWGSGPAARGVARDKLARAIGDAK